VPKLPTPHTAQIGDAPAFGGRRATADDFGAQADSGLIAAGHRMQSAATSLMTEMEEQEARKALVSSTQIRADYARKLDAASLSGEDTSKLKEQMMTELAKVGEGFATKRGVQTLETYTANSEIIYDQQANQIAVQRAWSEARLDGQRVVNSASALIQSNPSYLPIAEQNARDFVATFPKIRPEQRAELADQMAKQLNMAAAVSASRIDPEGTKAKLESGAWNLTPEQRQTAIDKAETEKRAKRADEAYHRAEEERQKRDQNDRGRDEGFASIMDGTFSRRRVMDDPRLTPATREHLILLAEARAKAGAAEERRSDPLTKRNLWMAINAPDGDPRKIYGGEAIFQAVEKGLINTTDANHLNSLVAAQKDENGRGFGQRLRERMIVLSRAMNDSPEYKNQPELASAIQMRLVADLEKKSTEMRRENKSPDTLLDPESKDYFFKPGVLKATADAVRQDARDTALRSNIGTKVVRDGFEWEQVGANPADPKSWKKGLPVSAKGVIR
jgi:DNA-directed RNA polymerase subunit F